MSHDTMAAFFSGQDAHTLEEEGNEANHFLSLIVNNAGQYVARITRKTSKSIHTTHEITEQFKTFEDAMVECNKYSTSEDSTENCIVYNDLNIVIEHSDYKKDFLENKMSELDVSTSSYVNGSSYKSKFSGGPVFQSTGEDEWPGWWSRERNERKPDTTYPQTKREGSKREIVTMGNLFGKEFETPAFVGSDVKESTKIITNKDSKPIDGIEEDDTFDDNILFYDELIQSVLDEDFIDNYVAILITGDILAGSKRKNPKTPDYVSDYAKHMNTYYSKIFSNMSQFTYFADGLVDALVNMVRDKFNNIAIEHSLEDKDSIEFVDFACMSWSDSVADKLKEYGSNPYVVYFVKVLENYG